MNLAICPLIPSATVNMLTGLTTTGATPTSNGPPVPSDLCEYPTSDPGATVKINRVCNMNAKYSYDGDRMQTPPMGATQTDVSGIGDAAFYQSEPAGTTSKSTLYAYKNDVLLQIVITGVKPAQEPMVKAGMISMGMTVFK